MASNGVSTATAGTLSIAAKRGGSSPPKTACEFDETKHGFVRRAVEGLRNDAVGAAAGAGEVYRRGFGCGPRVWVRGGGECCSRR